MWRMGNKEAKELREAALRRYSLHLEFVEAAGRQRTCYNSKNTRWEHGDAVWQRGNKPICQKCKEQFEAQRNKAIEAHVEPVMQRAARSKEAYAAELTEMQGKPLTGRQIVELEKQRRKDALGQFVALMTLRDAAITDIGGAEAYARAIEALDGAR